MNANFSFFHRIGSNLFLFFDGSEDKNCFRSDPMTILKWSNTKNDCFVVQMCNKKMTMIDSFILTYSVQWSKFMWKFLISLYSSCEGLTPYIHLAYHSLRVVRWSAKIAAANLTVFISIQKKITFGWQADKNQILWFVSSFAYVFTLWFYLQSIENKSFNNIRS